MSSLTTRLMRLFVVLSPLLITLASFAQDEEGKVPVARINRSSNLLASYAIMFLLLVMVVVVSLIPSKRGHQD